MNKIQQTENKISYYINSIIYLLLLTIDTLLFSDKINEYKHFLIKKILHCF